MQAQQLNLFEEATRQEPPPPPQGSRVVVMLSGGKDSVACLLLAQEFYSADQIIAHHQIIPEDWPGTVEYNQALCNKLHIPLYMAQANYSGYQCANCQAYYLTSGNEPYHRKCGGREGRYIMPVTSLLDLVTWREKWPSLDVRFCTSYLKRDVFNMWARRDQNRELLGPAPVVIMGERWLESKTRAKLPYLRPRAKMEYITEYRPILHYRRRAVFRTARDHGIDPHYCYKAQGMSEYQMYEEDREGGPRMSCVICFLKPEEQLRASYATEQGRPIVERGIQVERAIRHTLHHERSLESMVQA